MNEQDVLGAFLLVNNPIVLSEEETKDVQKAIKKLQQENKKLNGAIQTYDILLKANVEENKQLKEKLDCDLQWALKYEKQVGNWNKLKIYIKTEIPEDVFTDTEWFVSILDKMQELERRDSNVEN